MRLSKWMGVGFLSLSSLYAFGGRVRTLPTSSHDMPIISLLTGRSTVLRFPSAPKKVVLGNQNYFNVEFIDSDVTLQPLGAAASNLFVYGDGYTYGFILKVNHSGDYDDLVFIRGKVPVSSVAEKSSVPRTPPKADLKFSVVTPKNSMVVLFGERFKWNESINSYYADLFVTLRTEKSISSKPIQIQILQDRKNVSSIAAVFEEESLTPKVKHRVRVFAMIDRKKDLGIKMIMEGKEFTFDLKWKK